VKTNWKESLLACKVQASEAIKPWLILGPFYINFADRLKTLSFFEHPDSSVGKDVMNEVVEKAEEIICSSHYEGEESSFLGITKHWNLVRKPERYLTWGRYNFSNYLGVAFLTTKLTLESYGNKKFKFLTNARALISVNGETVFDTDRSQGEVKDNLLEYYFDLDLQSKENTFSIALFRIGRASTVGFSIECLNDTLEVQVPLTKEISPEIRLEVENEVNGIRLERDVFYPDHNIDIILDRTPSSEVQLNVKLYSLDGKLLTESSPKSGGRISLCSGREIPDGEYQISCSWGTKDDKPITDIDFYIAKITPTPSLVGYEHLDKRRYMLLEHFAYNLDYLFGELWTPVAGYILGGYERIWAQVARYALGRYKEIDEDIIQDTCIFISERKDCSEFLIQAILRLMYWERKNPQLSPSIRALMKDTILRFRYWVDEPGGTMMHMNSENHRLLLHTAEYLAGQLFPTEEFTNSHLRGLEHVIKGRMYLIEWLRLRGRFGFDEWHSNSYYPVNIAPLVNIYDFASEEDYKLRQMVKQVLDYMLFILAEDTFHGIFGTTHGRTYASYVKYPDFEYTSSICWLLYGEGSLWGGSGMGAVSLATSRYKLPKIFTKIATNSSIGVEAYHRQGFFTEKEQSANFIVYRTSDYMISSLQDYKKGEYAPQTHVAQVTLGNKAIIFWTCPSTSGEGPGLRPDYWSGNAVLPRVIQYHNVMALIWCQNLSSYITHCFFEPVKFDEVKFEGNWIFGRVNYSYIGIYSQHGVSIGDYGQYAGRELICYVPNNIWLVECGSKAEWGSFDRFVEVLKSSQIIEKDEGLVYLSPSIGEFVVGWNIDPTVNGTPIKLKDYPLISSAYAHSEFGSGHIILQYGNEKIELWFD